MNTLEYKPFYSRFLPHIQPPGVTFFITYRLANSIPKAVVDDLMREWRESTDPLKKLPDTEVRRDALTTERRRFFGRWDALLDQAAHGPHWLTQPDVAPIILENLHHFDGEHYALDCFCVMSNHVHVVLTPLLKEEQYVALPRIMHSLKGYTAVAANRVLNRDGQFWQNESFDVIVRDEKALRRIRRYVLNNPVKAGLVKDPEVWPYSYATWL